MRGTALRRRVFGFRFHGLGMMWGNASTTSTQGESVYSESDDYYYPYSSGGKHGYTGLCAHGYTRLNDLCVSETTRGSLSLSIR